MFDYQTKSVFAVVAVMGMAGSAQAQLDPILMSPVDAIATNSRLGNDLAPDSGAAQNTINGSGFGAEPNDINIGPIDVASDPADTPQSVWYVWKDGDNGGASAGAGEPPQQLYYDLGANLSLSSVTIWNENHRADFGFVTQFDVGTTSDIPAAFDVASMEGLTWTDFIVDEALSGGNGGIGTGQTFPIFATTRYLRLNVDAVNYAGNTFYALNEFAVGLGDPGSPPADFTWNSELAGDWNEDTNWSPTAGPPGAATTPISVTTRQHSATSFRKPGRCSMIPA